MSKLEDWLSTDERQREFAEEALIVDVAEKIWGAMESERVTKADLAERLGKSKAFVSQMLDGSRNMTLRSLADIAHSMGYRVRLSLHQRDVEGAWQPLNDAVVVQFNARYLDVMPVGNDVTRGAWTTIGEGRRLVGQ